MSKYTTGEMAKLCGVSVRTVQYYDTRGILIPSELSEGGRRLYSEDDVKRLKVICVLRDLGISINTILEIFAEEHPESVISLILEQQAKVVRDELDQKQVQLDSIEKMLKAVTIWPEFSVESISDIARIMENRKKLRRVRINMGIFAGVMGIVQWGGIITAIVTHNWRWFVFSYPFVLAACVLMMMYYFRNVSYICPVCHGVFKPKMKQFIFAKHTFTTRKLTCGCCGHHGFCVETAE